MAIQSNKWPPVGEARHTPPPSPSISLLKTIRTLGIDTTSPDRLARSLPFTPGDATAGAENEYQTAVIGDRDRVDLALEIEGSCFFRNLKKRGLRGDAPRSAVLALTSFLADNRQGVWENSWVRFPAERLNAFARRVFGDDLRADKADPQSPRRGDACRFTITVAGQPHYRVPVSYLMKLALADAIGEPRVHPVVRRTGEAALAHFLSDNTSPETFSFYPTPMGISAGKGQRLARETCLRFLLAQLLIQYANQNFCLIESGQRAVLYFAPHPPVRQKTLNNLIPDNFYRTLFMSPCLSGWNDGEAKCHYMHLCHTVLSRSQLNAVIKLRDAGIIANNLVVLPNTSNISLANNGTHISLGSRLLTRALKAPQPGFGPTEETYFGDLAIKIVEHFLPLFVGTYSAAPYRIDFMEFHPERVLGFLPHELDFTHLRMLWRRWKQKARLKICGRSVTPYGPKWLDRNLSRWFGLKGDVVPDYRLIDYLVALMATEESPALDGRIGSDERLKRDLAEQGVFDPCMPLYLLYRARLCRAMGFSGFEGRHYSLFENLCQDMAQAANLQLLVTTLAYKYIFTGRVGHADIPDHPFVESERRQIVFATAAAIPTVYVRRDTPNRLLARIVAKTPDTRSSRRYTGYTRLRLTAYRQALLRLIEADAPDLIELGGHAETLRDLAARLEAGSELSAAARLSRRICDRAGVASPLSLGGDAFNTAAEAFYREDLKQEQLKQAIQVWSAEVRELDSMASWRSGHYNQALLSILNGRDAEACLAAKQNGILQENLPPGEITRLIHLLLLTVHHMQQQDNGSAVGRTGG